MMTLKLLCVEVRVVNVRAVCVRDVPRVCPVGLFSSLSVRVRVLVHSFS